MRLFKKIQHFLILALVIVFASVTHSNADEPVYIRAGTLINVQSGSVQKDQVITITGDRIESVNDADDSIHMHSPQGRAIVRQMQGTQWNVHAVDLGGQEDASEAGCV